MNESQTISWTDDVDRVSVFSVEPGDTLVVTVPGMLTADSAQRIKDTIGSQLTVDVPVIVVPPGVEFTVVRPGSA